MWRETDVRREERQMTSLQQLRAIHDTVHRRHNAQTAATAQLTGVVESLRTHVSAAQNGQAGTDSGAELDAVVQARFDRLTSDLLAQVRRIVSNELSMRLGEHQTNITEQLHLAVQQSRATTPVNATSTAELRAAQNRQISALLQQEKYNAAFEFALSANDILVVEFICESLDPLKVFNVEPCPLHQSVLLSLIHHLSTNLYSNTELKHRYLEESISALDQHNRVTREHLSTVLTQLRTNLTAYVQSGSSNDKMLRPMTKLLKICELILATPMSSRHTPSQ